MAVGYSGLVNALGELCGHIRGMLVMKKPARIAAFAIAAAATVPLLTACTPTAPVYMRIVDGTPEFLICEAIQAEEITVSLAATGTLDYLAVWRASGHTLIEAGDTLTYGVAISGWTSEVGPGRPTFGGQDILIRLGDAVHTEVIPSGAHIIQGGYSIGQLASDRWTDSAGHVVDGCP